MTYYIAECFINDLEKKLTTIRNKCEKYGCEFYYERIGEKFDEVVDNDGNKHIVKFIEVEASGLAIINDWRFVALIEHTSEGNIIRQYDTNLNVPERYRHTDCICEHCGTLRRRKDTCLIYNDITGEWKQVGKSCLKDFTQGLDADIVAKFTSYKDLFEEYTSIDRSSYSYKHYSLRDGVLLYAVETVNHFGYISSQSYDYSTASRCSDYYNLLEFGKVNAFRKREDIEADLNRITFDPRCESNLKYIEDLKQYVLNEDSTNNEYIHNLQVLVKSEYISDRDWNLLVSSVQFYNRHIENVKKDELRKKSHDEELKSEHVGNIKDKVSLDVETCTLVTSWDNQFGWSGMYKFVSKEGNIFIWITSKDIDTDNVSKVCGTVKEHSEYNGVKQTVLTRCKVEYKPEETHEDDGTFNLNEIFNTMEV